eukprot:COSAG02_NODE_5054_length_4687_cov_7.076504_5_plen_58_part_00
MTSQTLPGHEREERGDRLIPQVRGAAVLQPLPDPIGVLKRGGIDAHIIDEIYDSRYR